MMVQESLAHDYRTEYCGMSVLASVAPLVAVVVEFVLIVVLGLCRIPVHVVLEKELLMLIQFQVTLFAPE